MALSLPGPLSRIFTTGTLYGSRPQVAWLRGRKDVATPADLYRVLRAYYLNNSLYTELADILRREGIWREALHPYRNPAFAVVETYPSYMWPGSLPDAMPIVTENESIVPSIEQVWKWSNWAGNKQVYARQIALFGDAFIKVASTDNGQRVYLQLLEPEYVTDFDTDERGFLQWVRIDVPRSRRLANGGSEWYWHTEVWDAPAGMFRVWEQNHSPTTPTDQLGTPRREQPISTFGIDFVPIVHAKFQDIGEDRGTGCFTTALDAIDESNRQATRLSQMLFRHNDVTWALKANSVDASGRPLPPPRISDSAEPTVDESTVTLGGDRLLKLPGMSELQSLVPDVKYDAALSILQDHQRYLEQLMPELAFTRMAEERDLSGRAVRLMLGRAIKRLEEARGNAEAALIRAQQMALTIGSGLGLFANLGGDFDSGAFEHSFEARDVLPADDLERAQTQQANAQALASYVTAGVPVEIAAVEVLGWTEEQTKQFTRDRLAAIKREQALVAEDVTEPEEEEEPLE